MNHGTDIKSRSCQSLPAVSAVLCVGGEVDWLSTQASGNISSRDSSLLRAVANTQFCWMQLKGICTPSKPLPSPQSRKEKGRHERYHMRLRLRECNWLLPSRVERKAVTGITTVQGWYKSIIDSKSRKLVLAASRCPGIPTPGTSPWWRDQDFILFALLRYNCLADHTASAMGNLQ